VLHPAGQSRPPTGGSIDRIIRVRLQADVRRAEVELDGPFQVVDPSAGRVLSRLEAPAGLFYVAFEKDTITCPTLGATWSAACVDLVPMQSRTVGVRCGSDMVHFAGRLRLVRGPDGTGLVLNLVDIEQYLVSVVAGELDRRFHPETFCAQAIAARTFAWFQKRTVGRNRAWDVTADERSQVYPGLERRRQVPLAEWAVHRTRGLVCTWHSPAGWKIFCTYYSSACGGWTQSADAIREGSAIPPLEGNVRCVHCRDAPGFSWGPVTIRKTALAERLRERYALFRKMGRIRRVEVLRRTPAGRPVVIGLIDEQGRTARLEAENFRLALDPTGRLFRSTLCRLVDEPDRIVIEDGRGFGHGVGLCQYGAEGLARGGMKAGAILRRYYPGCRLSRAY